MAPGSYDPVKLATWAEEKPGVAVGSFAPAAEHGELRNEWDHAFKLLMSERS